MPLLMARPANTAQVRSVVSPTLTQRIDMIDLSTRCRSLLLLPAEPAGRFFYEDLLPNLLPVLAIALPEVRPPLVIPAPLRFLMLRAVLLLVCNQPRTPRSRACSWRCARHGR